LLVEQIFYGTTVLVQPFFSTASQFTGMLISAPIILGLWYSPLFDTGYFVRLFIFSFEQDDRNADVSFLFVPLASQPMISNRIFANDGGYFNVTMILDENKLLDVEKYSAYSKPYMASSNVSLLAFGLNATSKSDFFTSSPHSQLQIILYGGFFAIYVATVVHTILYHRREIMGGFRTAYKSIRAGEKGNASFKDYHNRAMMAYNEVPETWYLGVTVLAVVLGCIALTVYPYVPLLRFGPLQLILQASQILIESPFDRAFLHICRTHSSVSAIFFGLFLCIILVIPIGIIYSITGVQVTLNVFAEFIGGLIYPGNALVRTLVLFRSVQTEDRRIADVLRYLSSLQSMNYFKSYGVMTTMNAISFAQDLKLAHYVKIPQRFCFGEDPSAPSTLFTLSPLLTRCSSPRFHSRTNLRRDHSHLCFDGHCQLPDDDPQGVPGRPAQPVRVILFLRTVRVPTLITSRFSLPCISPASSATASIPSSPPPSFGVPSALSESSEREASTLRFSGASASERSFLSPSSSLRESGRRLGLPRYTFRKLPSSPLFAF
jgi:hypothetical protein